VNASQSKIQVWIGRLDLESARIAGLSGLLSEQERCRARRFYFSADSRSFTAAHAMLRFILGRALELAPARVNFEYGPFGKPFLLDTALRFNAAHSGELALVAVTHGREVGVDIEQVRARPEMHRIAERVFPRREFAELESAPAEAKTELFFQLWTRNEARLKASGLGLGGARHQAEDCWSVREICPEAGYAGAVAAERGFDLELRPFHWPDSGSTAG